MCAIQERIVQLPRSVQWKAGLVSFAVTAVSWRTARGPAAPEENRLADQCSETYGFENPRRSSAAIWA